MAHLKMPRRGVLKVIFVRLSRTTPKGSAAGMFQVQLLCQERLTELTSRARREEQFLRIYPDEGPRDPRPGVGGRAGASRGAGQAPAPSPPPPRRPARLHHVVSVRSSAEEGPPPPARLRGGRPAPPRGLRFGRGGATPAERRGDPGPERMEGSTVRRRGRGARRRSRP